MECNQAKLSESDIKKLPKFIIMLLMGLPGSGKTTLCHTLPYILGNKYHILHVCFDQVVEFHEEWSNEGSYGMWKSERAKVLSAIEGLIKDILLIQETFKIKNEPNMLGQSESASLHQQVCLENSSSQDVTNEKVIQEETCRKNSIPSEKVLDGLHLRDGVSLNSRDVGVFVNDSIDKCSITEWGISSTSPVNILNQELNFVDWDKLQNKLILLCVDDNFYYHSMRKEWWNLAAKYELAFCTLVVRCALDLCIERVRERTSLHPQLDVVNVPIGVIKRMSERFELPDEKLCQWEKHSSVVDTSNLKLTSSKMPGLLFRKRYVVDEMSVQAFDNIKGLLFHSLLDPAKPLIVGVNSECFIATPSVIHKVDLVLRKVVGRSEKSLKAVVNKKRKDILEDLKNGRLHIPKEFTDEVSNEKSLEKYVVTLIDM